MVNVTKLIILITLPLHHQHLIQSITIIITIGTEYPNIQIKCHKSLLVINIIDKHSTHSKWFKELLCQQYSIEYQVVSAIHSTELQFPFYC